MPTKEGYDACLGFIEGAKSACCGHGVERAYVVRWKIEYIRCKEMLFWIVEKMWRDFYWVKN